MYGYTPARFGDEYFDSIVEFVANNLEPEEVFSMKILAEWVKDNASELGVIPMEDFDDEARKQGYILRGEE